MKKEELKEIKAELDYNAKEREELISEMNGIKPFLQEFRESIESEINACEKANLKIRLLEHDGCPDINLVSFMLSIWMEHGWELISHTFVSGYDIHYYIVRKIVDSKRGSKKRSER